MQRVLVANRGEIARRVIRAAHALGLDVVAVYSEPDEGSPHVREADIAVPLGGATATESYLDVEKVLAAASATGSDAVHPGYGFLAESAEFAEACEGRGLTFVGPPAAVIRSMGSKVEAKRIMAAAGVPVVPGTELPEATDPVAAGQEVGFPLLVKASAGGGGRGMRVVAAPEELGEAIEHARREARSSFGDPTVFLERLLARPRHVEVQLLADAGGRVVHLFERECSIQRRYQKVIEEAPSPGISPELRRRMCDASVVAGEAVRYVGAGTIEYLVDGDDFYFLEMNTRIQVEHPVTEAVTGIDLVQLQLRVAAGEPLPFEQDDVHPQGHAIEARLYAEDPAQGFVPTAGRLDRFTIPPGDVRVDAGAETGSIVTSHYDGMLAKVIVHAPRRRQAARRLARALAASEIHGPPTNREFLVGALRSEAFLSGDTTTDFVERHPELLDPAVSDSTFRLHAVAAAAVGQHRRRRDAPVLAFAPSGWRNVPSVPQRAEFLVGERRVAVDYWMRGDVMEGSVGGEAFRARCHAFDEGGVDLELDGIRRHVRVHTVGDVCWVHSPDAQVALREVPRFPDRSSVTEAGALTAPMPGTIIDVLVGEGDEVHEGDTLIVLEAMKMEHRILATRGGVVTEVHVREGDAVEAHQILIALADGMLLDQR